MKSMFGLDLSVITIAIMFAIVGSIYAIFGGLRAIAVSDTFNANACVKALSMRVSIVFAVIGIALVPVLQNARSIIALLQQLNGLYSMPVLAAFLVAILFGNVKPRAIMISMLMGFGLYAIFTFAWTPLHYIHLMCITLLATMGCSLLLNKVVYGQTAQLRLGSKASKGHVAEAA